MRANLDGIAIDDADEIGCNGPGTISAAAEMPDASKANMARTAAHPPRIRTTFTDLYSQPAAYPQKCVTQGAAFAQLCDPMALGRAVGLRVKALRQRRGLSQEELAERIDRSLNAVSSIERGRTLPNFTTLERLSEVLGVPVREFFDHQPDASDNPRRARLMSELFNAARELGDADLELALEQVRVLSRARPKGKRKR
jgi:transcriptional regulator with XRE-family HTH domain